MITACEMLPQKRQPDKTDIGKALSEGAFLLDPRAYGVIDGDTIGIRPPRLPKGREETKVEWAARRLSIRLFSINASERLRYTSLEKTLAKTGYDIHQDSIGRVATETARALLASRALLIEPVNDPQNGYFDRYGRLLAHVTVSGRDGPDFICDNAFSLELKLVDFGLARPLPGKPLPPRISDIVAREFEARKFRDTTSPAWG